RSRRGALAPERSGGGSGNSGAPGIALAAGFGGRSHRMDLRETRRMAAHRTHRSVAGRRAVAAARSLGDAERGDARPRAASGLAVCGNDRRLRTARLLRLDEYLAGALSRRLPGSVETRGAADSRGRSAVLCLRLARGARAR